MLAVTLVLARVLAEANGPAPALSDEAILVLKRHDIRVGNGCTGTGTGGATTGTSGVTGRGAGRGDGPPQPLITIDVANHRQRTERAPVRRMWPS